MTSLFDAFTLLSETKNNWSPVLEEVVHQVKPQKSVLLPQKATTVQESKPVTPVAVVKTEPSYLEMMGAKRKEIVKVVGYALMILFALTLYTAIDFWLKELVEKYDWSQD